MVEHGTDAHALGEVSNVDVDLNLWGKSRGLAREHGPTVTYPLVCHLLDAAAFAGAIWDSYLSAGLKRWLSRELGLSEQQTRCFVMFLAGVHDIGKACPGFQQKVAVPDGYPQQGDCADHARAGHLWMAAALLHKLAVPSEVAIRIGEIVGGHHGVFETFGSQEFENRKMGAQGLGAKQWGRQRTLHLEAIRRVLGFTRWPKTITRPAQVVLCAIVVLSDWLASRNRYVRSRLADVPHEGRISSLATFFADSQQRARLDLAEAGLTRLQLKPGTFQEEFGFTPNRLQHSLESTLPQTMTGPGLLIITEQTGQGKTEAALYASRIMSEAAGTAGLSFLLPTMATSNSMECRITGYLEERANNPAALNLLHSMAWLRRVKEEMTRDETVSSQATDMLTVVTEWLSGGKKAAFAPVSVGTIDQALLSVLPVRHNVFRMLAFANKTIVIDEIHAFDSYVYELLATFLDWCGKLGVPVVLMSATLPRPVARRLAAAYLGKPTGSECDITLSYPGWCYVDQATHRITTQDIPVADAAHEYLDIEIDACETTPLGMARLSAVRTRLAPLLASHGSAAIICTTVEEAQRTYTQLRAWLDDNRHDDAQLLLLHARMPLWQRETITDTITSRFGKNGDRSGQTIIVSTQVIEQSLNVDFDLVITDLAPLELLLQRAGRAKRHPENDSRRPTWAKEKKLIVLSPQTRDKLAVPAGWHMIYPEAAMIRTFRLLKQRTGHKIQIPGDVQALLDQVHTDPALITGHEKADTTSRAESMVQAHEALRKSIPRPQHITQIVDVSKGAGIIDDESVSTRFNADSVRVLPCFNRDDELYLDRQCQRPMPTPTWKQGTPTWRNEELASIIEHTIPLHASYVDEAACIDAQPREWHKHYLLKHVLPLVMHIDDQDQLQPAVMGRNRFRLDPQLGLIR